MGHFLCHCARLMVFIHSLVERSDDVRRCSFLEINLCFELSSSGDPSEAATQLPVDGRLMFRS